jgi:hypothetical protein
MSFKVIFQRTWSSFQTTSRECVQLARASSRSEHQYISVLIHQARDHQNQVAARLLRANKQWNDLRHYGLMEYAQRNLMPTTAMILTGPEAPDLTSGASTTTTTTTTASEPAKRVSSLSKVAFMVTASS